MSRPVELDPELRQLVERYHRNDLPLELFDDAFVRIVANEAALGYLEQLEGRGRLWPTATLPPSMVPPPPMATSPIAPVPMMNVSTPMSTLFPAAMPQTNPIQNSNRDANPNSDLSSMPTAPVAAIEEMPAVARTTGSMLPAKKASAGDSIIGFAGRIVACLAMAGLVAALYWMQPSYSPADRPMIPALSAGMSAN